MAKSLEMYVVCDPGRDTAPTTSARTTAFLTASYVFFKHAIIEQTNCRMSAVRAFFVVKTLLVLTF